MARAAAARATAVAGWAAASAMDRAEATATASPAVARASAARVTAAAGWVRPRAMATTAAAPARAGVIVAALTKRSRSRLLLLDDASSFSDDDLGVVVDVGGEVSSRGGLFMSMQIFMSAHFVHRRLLHALSLTRASSHGCSSLRRFLRLPHLRRSHASRMNARTTSPEQSSQLCVPKNLDEEL